MTAAGAAPQDAIWHVLQYSDALDFELAGALAEFASVTLWKPHRHRLPFGPGPAADLHEVPQAGLQIRSFPLLRGFARFPISVVARTGVRIAERLLAHTPGDARDAVLVCTTPFFAPVAERWPGPVVYWLTDLIARYEGASFRRVLALDRRMCKVARLVCPNSERIAAYLRGEADLAKDRCVVLPNATGQRSLLPAALLKPTPVPQPFSQLQRPIAGVIGNLAENTDWVLLRAVLDKTPWLFWLFVGPAHAPIHDRAQRDARTELMRHPRACFIGAQPYTELRRFARAVDVAVLPYRLREPTFSGSSTRFYDHLAACHPILATDAVAELRSQPPLLQLVRSPEEAADALLALRDAGFEDGLRWERWRMSRTCTWRERALTLRRELAARLPARQAAPPRNKVAENA